MAANLAGKAFIPYYNELMDFLEMNNDLKKSARGIFTQVALTAAPTAVGGIVGGPLGAMVGGVAGSAIGYYFSSDYDSLIKVLWGLSNEDRWKLVAKVQQLVVDTSIEALKQFTSSEDHRKELFDLFDQFAKQVKGE